MAGSGSGALEYAVRSCERNRIRSRSRIDPRLWSNFGCDSAPEAVGSWLHTGCVPLDYRPGRSRPDEPALNRRGRDRRSISSADTTGSRALRSARSFYDSELRVSGRTAVLQCDDAGAGSSRSPRPSLRYGRSAGICRFHYRSIADISIFYGPNADTRDNYGSGNWLPEKCGSLHDARWTCFHVRADCISLSAFLATALSLLPGSQRDSRKEAHRVA